MALSSPFLQPLGDDQLFTHFNRGSGWLPSAASLTVLFFHALTHAGRDHLIQLNNRLGNTPGGRAIKRNHR